MKNLRLTFYLSIVLFLFFTNSLKAQQPDSIEQKIKKSIDKSLSIGVLPSKLKGIQLAASSMFIILDSNAKVESVLISESLTSVFDAREKIIAPLKVHINGLDLDKSSFENTYFMVIIMIGSLQETNIQLAKMPDNWETLFKGLDTQQLKGKTLKYCYPVRMNVFSIKN